MGKNLPKDSCKLSESSEDDFTSTWHHTGTCQAPCLEILQLLHGSTVRSNQAEKMQGTEAEAMSRDEKELLRLITQMTETEWRKLRMTMRHDEKIMYILDHIGAKRGWTT